MMATILFLFLAVAVSQASVYPIIDRRELDETPSPSASPTLISFDGDLDRIKELALAKAAASNGASPTISPAPSVSPAPTSKPVLQAFECEGEPANHLEILTWKYTIETVPNAVVETVIGEVQEILLEHVAPYTLSCLNPAADYAKIVKMDTAIPSDEPSPETCSPELDDSYTCTVVDGRMRLFVLGEGNIEDAAELVLAHIKKAVEADGFVTSVGSGLMKITFISVETDSSTPVPIEGPTKDEDVGGASGTESRTPLAVTLVAVGSTLLVVLMGSIYYWRRGAAHDQDGAATQAAGSSVHTSTLNSSSSARPASPFSEMVPGAYKLGENMSILSNSHMDPVFEDGDAESIMVSESGYSTEAGETDAGESTTLSSTVPRALLYQSDSVSSPDYLGARPRDGAAMGISDSELDSSMETSNAGTPNKSFGDKLLVASGGDDIDESNKADESLFFEQSGSVHIIPPDDADLVDVSLSEP